MDKAIRTALLMIDFINLFDFDDAAALAPRAIRAARATARLKARARAAGVRCIYANDNFGNWTSEFTALARKCLKRPGPAATIARLLEPQERDLSVLKPRHSAFYGTPLGFLLDDLRVTHLVITGIAADQCVFATAQDAYVRQYRVWVPADCVAASSPGYEKSALAQMARTLKARTTPARDARGFTWKGERARRAA
jgi:nicotinamidase-related amidase